MPELDENRSPGGSQPAAELLPELYAELRRLAAALTARLSPGQTLQPTALVHEAYLRLVGRRDPGGEGRRHFFGAAARAMREILIEPARRKGCRKRTGRRPSGSSESAGRSSRCASGMIGPAVRSDSTPSGGWGGTIARAVRGSEEPPAEPEGPLHAQGVPGALDHPVDLGDAKRARAQCWCRASAARFGRIDRVSQHRRTASGSTGTRCHPLAGSPRTHSAAATS